MGGMLVDNEQLILVFNQPVGVKHLADDPVPSGCIRREKSGVRRLELA